MRKRPPQTMTSDGEQELWTEDVHQGSWSEAQSVEEERIEGQVATADIRELAPRQWGGRSEEVWLGGGASYPI